MYTTISGYRCFIFIFNFGGRGGVSLCSPGWLGVCCVTQIAPKPVIFWLSSPDCFGYKQAHHASYPLAKDDQTQAAAVNILSVSLLCPSSTFEGPQELQGPLPSHMPRVSFGSCCLPEELPSSLSLCFLPGFLGQGSAPSPPPALLCIHRHQGLSVLPY